MLRQVKKMKELKSTQGVLLYVKIIVPIKQAEDYKKRIGMDSNYEVYEQLQRIGYKIAIQKAKTPDELELCASTVELNDCGIDDIDEWAENIRIKAYGPEWYIYKHLGYIKNYLELLQFVKDPKNKNEDDNIKGDNYGK